MQVRPGEGKGLVQVHATGSMNSTLLSRALSALGSFMLRDKGSSELRGSPWSSIPPEGLHVRRETWAQPRGWGGPGGVSGWASRLSSFGRDGGGSHHQTMAQIGSALNEVPLMPLRVMGGQEPGERGCLSGLGKPRERVDAGESDFQRDIRGSEEHQPRHQAPGPR